ncbi:DNA polymerase alpha-binding protein [Monosporozyma servazzii]
MSAVVNKETVFESGGKTVLSIENSKYNILYAANKNAITKVLQTDHPETEPDFVDSLEQITSLKSVSETRFIMTNMKGDASLYDTKAKSSKLLARSALPLRACDLIHSGNTAIFGGDDLQLTMVDLDDSKNTHILNVQDQVHQLSYNLRTNMLAVSLINGTIYFYSLTSTQPNEVKKLDGYIIKASYKEELDVLDDITHDDLDSDNEDELSITDKEFCDENRISTRVAWSPSGHNFAIPCYDMKIKVFNLKDYAPTKTLEVNGTESRFIDVQFDPLEGKYVAAIDLKNKLTIWDWKVSKVVYERDLKSQVTNLVWKIDSKDGNKKKLDLLIGTWVGSIINIKNVADAVPLLREASSINDTMDSNVTKKTGNGLFVGSDESDLDGLVNSDIENKANGMLDDMAEQDDGGDNDSDNLFTQEENPKKRKLYADEDEGAIDDDESNGGIADDNRDGFIEDDDGAGYVVERRHQPQSRSHKRVNGSSLPTISASRFKYKPISPGATPLGNGERRYLTMNTIGYVSTVRNNEQYSITVSFFDTGKYSEYHFEDLFGFDACFLNERGALFAQSKMGQIQYRPHDSMHSNWTKTIPLNKSEVITAIAATPKRVIVGTSFGYVRIFNQFGIPLSVEKMSPVVALTAYDYRVFLVHYSQYNGLSFSLFEQTSKTTVYYHRESSLPIPLPQTAIPHNTEFEHTAFDNFNPIGIKSLFFSEYGDPCIFGKDDILLILNKWRRPRESRWVPILDAKMEIWQMSGGKDSNDIHVWPLGLTTTSFTCILVKGKEIWPGFPLPLPSDMELRVPILVKKQLWEFHLEKEREKEEQREQEGVGAIVEEDDDKNIEIPVEMQAEEESVRNKVLTDLLTDTIENDGELYGNEAEIVTQLKLSYDKAILRLLAAACSSQNSEKALSLVLELKQDVALNAAAKIAERAEMMTLMKKINEMREARFEQEMNNM